MNDDTAPGTARGRVDPPFSSPRWVVGETFSELLALQGGDQDAPETTSAFEALIINNVAITAEQPGSDAPLKLTGEADLSQIAPLQRSLEAFDVKMEPFAVTGALRQRPERFPLLSVTTAPLLAGASFVGGRLGLSALRASIRTLDIDDEGGGETELALLADLGLAGVATLPMVAIAGSAAWLQFELAQGALETFKANQAENWKALSALVGYDNLRLPDVFDKLDMSRVRLEQLAVGIGKDEAAWRVTEVMLTVGFPLTDTEVGFGQAPYFHVSKPYISLWVDPEAPKGTLGARLGGTLNVAKAKGAQSIALNLSVAMEAGASSPTIQATLPAPVAFADLIGAFGEAEIKALNGLSLSAMDLSLAPKPFAFRFEAATRGSIALPFGGGQDATTLEVKHGAISLEKQGGDLRAKLSADVKLGKAPLSATLGFDRATGISFSAALSPTQREPVTLGDFRDAFGASWSLPERLMTAPLPGIALSLTSQAQTRWSLEVKGLQSLFAEGGTGPASLAGAIKLVGLDLSPPDWLGTIRFQQLDVALEQGASFAWRIEGKADTGCDIWLGRKRLTARLALKVAGGAQTTLALDGDLTVGPATFAAQIRLGRDDTRLKATWSAGIGPGLTFSDLAGALGVELPPIPDALRPELASASFEWDFSRKTLSAKLTSRSGGKIDVSAGSKAGTELTFDAPVEIGAARFRFQGRIGGEGSSLSGLWQAKGAEGLTVGDIGGWLGVSLPAIPASLSPKLVKAEIRLGHQGVTLARLVSESGGTALLYVNRDKETRILFGASLNLNIVLADLPMVGKELPAGIGQLGIDHLGVWAKTARWSAADVEAANKALQAPDPGGPAPSESPASDPAKPAAVVSDAKPKTKLQRLEVADAEPALVIYGAFRTAADAASEFRLPLGGGQAAPPAPAPTGKPRERGAQELETSAPDTGKSAQNAAPSGASVPTPTPTNVKSDGVTWMDIRKRYGPLDLGRVGLAYADERFTVALDASIAVGPLALSLDGLAVSTRLDRIKPEFDLRGLGFSVQKGALTIGGAFAREKENELWEHKFSGAIVLSFKKVAITGIGSYTKLKTGQTSIFLFAQVLAPIGGPPAFFVTGLLAGVGYNHALRLPAMDEVQAFPLLNLDRTTPSEALQMLEGKKPSPGRTEPIKWIRPRAGSYWLAAGLKFKSFGLVDTTALVVVQPTETLTIGLFGLSSLQMPPDIPGAAVPRDKAFLFIELQMRVVLQPERGLLESSALLSASSFLLQQQCRLTGGFAFYLWFAPSPQAGDFVLTLGGYHPHFKPPTHYPSVPRLGVSWQVNSKLSLKGEAYFAVTPSHAMDGLSILCKYEDNNLRASFAMVANFIATWKPFYYVTDAAISIDIAYTATLGPITKTLSASASAQMQLWGPPTGGFARVQVAFISFDVKFGEPLNDPGKSALDWPAFATLLPEPPKVCQIVASQGLIAVEGKDDHWLATTRGFGATASSAIPVTGAAANGRDIDLERRALDIRPMRKRDLQSVFTIQVARDGRPVDDISDWTLEPLSGVVPPALFGSIDAPGGLTAEKGVQATTGVALSTPAPAVGRPLGPISRKAITQDTGGKGRFGTMDLLIAVKQPKMSSATLTRLAQADDQTANQARDRLVERLRSRRLYAGPTPTMSRLVREIDEHYTHQPLVYSATEGADVRR